jgi:hypothetical protein
MPSSHWRISKTPTSRGTQLAGANLKGSHLEGANLGSAEGLTPDQIIQASGDNRTILPDGLPRPEHWARIY